MSKQPDEVVTPDQAYYQRGYTTAQRLYSHHPGLTDLSLAKLASQERSNEQKLVPLAKFCWYKDGFIAGYRDVEKQSEERDRESDV